MGFLSNVVGSISGGASDIITGGISGLASAYGASQQQASSKEMAKKQMRFQERMSNTAHQREVKDLRKAGLNPILSANKGASSPGGAQGIAQNITGAGMASALQASQNRANINLVNAQSKKVGWESDPVTKVKTIMESLNVRKYDDLPGTMRKIIDVLGFSAKEVDNMMSSKISGTLTKDQRDDRDNKYHKSIQQIKRTRRHRSNMGGTVNYEK